MMRGSLSNTTSPTLWIYSDVLLKCAGRFMYIGPKRYVLQRESWLWSITYLLKPVIIYVEHKPNKLLEDYDHLVFDDFYEARVALNRDIRAVEMVVDSPLMVCDNCVLFESNLKRYC